jgi:hypothetical protein
MSTPSEVQPPYDPPLMAGVRRIALGGLVLAIVLALGVWWAGSRGYVPPMWEGSWGCSDVGYPNPPPSFDELVNKHGESPYCARRVRGEEWF